MGFIGRLLVWLSGADYETLAVQHGRVRAKYVGTGAGIVITGLIAGLSMWFALTTALGIAVAAAVPLAVGWALVIMSIDRWLVVSLERRDGRGAVGYLIAASPRLALALVLGFVISTPMTLRVFQKEIDFALEQTQSNARTAYLNSPARKSLESQIQSDRERVASLAAGGTGTNAAQAPAVTNMENELASDKTKLYSDTANETQFYNEWQCEAYGVPLPNGSSCPGPAGPLAAAAKNSYQGYQASVQQDQTAITNMQGSIAAAQAGEKTTAGQELPEAEQALKDDQDQLANQDAEFAARNAGNTGLLDRINALDAASAASPGLQAARWLLFLVFLLIDCLPALMAITHVLNDPDDYEQATGQGAATRKQITDKNLRDLELDADSLSRERERRRGSTAKAQAEAEQQVRVHKARRWARRQTWLGRRSVRNRANWRVTADSGSAWSRATMPTTAGTRQVFVRRYAPRLDQASQNGHFPGGHRPGGTP